MKEESAASWQHLPFYRALTDHILFLGAPRSVLVINGITTFMFIMYFHFVYILALSVTVHFLCVYLSQDDAQWFDCGCQYFRRKNYYST